MRDRKVSLHVILGLVGALSLILVLGLVSGEISGAGALAQTATGACCQAAACTQQTSAACLALPGVYHGDGVSCSPNPCQDLTGEICRGSSEVIDGRVYCIMRGRLPDCWALQIDDLDNNVSTTPDANLTSNPPNANDRNYPSYTAPDPPCTGNAAIYKDWADLPISTLGPAGSNPTGQVENNRILDWTGAKDVTTLHGDCLTLGNAHAKEDFTQSYLANNETFLYFAQERRTNNGNSTFYWLLTHEPPIIDTSVCTTGGDKGELQFNLTQDDVRVVVAFAGSGGITIFTNAYDGSPTGYIPVSEAVFHPEWLGFQQPVHNLALVAEGGGDDAFAPWGGIDDQGNMVLSGSFAGGEMAEWAVDLADVFHGAPLCGQELFVTGVSRAATGDPDKITESADLKDFIGPKLFSFGGISAEIALTPVPCGDKFDYKVTVTDTSGNPITPDTITWNCDPHDDMGFKSFDPSVAEGTGELYRNVDGLAHTVTCTVTVEAGGCSFTTPEEEISVKASLSAILVEFDPDLKTCGIPCLLGVSQGNIGDGFTLAPVITGGSGSYNVTWSFFPGNIGVACAQPQADPKVCTVQVPDSIHCASIATHIRVTDSQEPACVPFDADLGFIRKATILQFAEPPITDNNISCSTTPPVCCTPGVNCP